jgi:serine/threonine-protein kinase
MPLQPGQTLLHYRLAEKIGEGGMGVVWRARDTSLDRDVALKVLPEALADDPERLARLEREARLLASVNHPGIAGVYGLHEAESTRFIALELVPGEDLSQRLARGALPLEEAARIARRIAAALTAAHDQGVIHRDLKPSNVKVTPDGDVKILDFGLAKAFGGDEERADAGGSPSMSPTLTAQATLAGMIMGTAAYMSPEQARGQAVDRRADTWAFGVMLYEMLAGGSAFAAPTITDTLAAVLRGEPDWDAMPPEVSPAVRRVLERCLEKDPRRRLRDVGDVALLLDDALAAPTGTDPDAGVQRPATQRWREPAAWLLAAAATIVAVTLWTGGTRERSGTVPAAMTRFALQLDEAHRLTFVDRPILALSRDGRQIAFIAVDPESREDMVHVRVLDDDEIRRVPGTEGATVPFFSPDGSRVGFFVGGWIKTVPIAGGTPVSVVHAPNLRGAAWLPDDTIVYSGGYGAGLSQIPATGGSPAIRTEIDAGRGERTHRWIDVHPDGETVVFTIGYANSPNNYDGASIAVHAPGDEHARIVIENAHMARFAGANSLVFMRKGTLYRVGYDPARQQVVGEERPVLSGVGGDPSSGVGFWDLARNGTLVYVEGAVTSADARLTLVDRAGELERLPIEPSGYHHPRFSRDGKHIAFTNGEGMFGAAGDVWICELESGLLNRLTFDERSLYPLWNPDGKHVTFSRHGEGAGLYVKAADGSGNTELLTATQSSDALAGDWSPDGRTLAYLRIDRSTDIMLLERGGEPRLFQPDASAPAFSPDGKLLAYQSPAAGNARLFVREVDGEGKWQVAADGAGYPRWSRDGKQLFYLVSGERERPLRVIDVDLASGFRSGPPRTILAETSQLFTTSTAPLMNWDAAPDGSRFVFVELSRAPDAAGRIEVVLGWTAEIEAAAR